MVSAQLRSPLQVASRALCNCSVDASAPRASTGTEGLVGGEGWRGKTRDELGPLSFHSEIW